MVTIRLENLPEEYRKKLCARELTRETIASLAASVSDQYLLRKRTFKKVAVMLPALTLLMAVLTFFAPAAERGSINVILGSFGFTLLVEIVILAAVYFLTVTRVPRQFAKCLQKGYPELEIVYGYAQLTDGSLSNQSRPRQLPFSLQIEQVFALNNSEDVVVVGFVHGLIERGNSVLILDKNDPSGKRTAAIVSAVEKADRAVVQAADCNAALKIQKGAQLGLTPGMYLYRK